MTAGLSESTNSVQRNIVASSLHENGVFSPISCPVIQGSTGRLLFGLDPHMNVLADKLGDMTFVYLIVLDY